MRPALAGVACGAVANPLCTAGARSGPRLACALHVWEIMRVKDCGRVAAPRASTGCARDAGSFLRSFTFCQILSPSIRNPLIFIKSHHLGMLGSIRPDRFPEEAPQIFLQVVHLVSEGC